MRRPSSCSPWNAVQSGDALRTAGCVWSTAHCLVHTAHVIREGSVDGNIPRDGAGGWDKKLKKILDYPTTLSARIYAELFTENAAEQPV